MRISADNPYPVAPLLVIIFGVPSSFFGGWICSPHRPFVSFLFCSRSCSPLVCPLNKQNLAYPKTFAPLSRNKKTLKNFHGVHSVPATRTIACINGNQSTVPFTSISTSFSSAIKPQQSLDHSQKNPTHRYSLPLMLPSSTLNFLLTHLSNLAKF